MAAGVVEGAQDAGLVAQDQDFLVPMVKTR